jgi:hypothetical protein
MKPADKFSVSRISYFRAPYKPEPEKLAHGKHKAHLVLIRTTETEKPFKTSCGVRTM